MSVSENDAILRERSAFGRGVAWGRGEITPKMDGWVTEMNRLFPLPKVTRPREEFIKGATYRVVDGRLEQRIPVPEHGVLAPLCHIWRPVDEVPFGHVAGVAELLANPTEEIEIEVEA